MKKVGVFLLHVTYFTVINIVYKYIVVPLTEKIGFINNCNLIPKTLRIMEYTYIITISKALSISLK